MSIHDFHSKLVSGGERTVLFAALRKLSLLDPRNVVMLDEGWPIWDSSTGSPPLSATSA